MSERKRKRGPANDLDQVLAKCRGLKEELRKKASIKVDLPDDVPSAIVEVNELSSSEVIEGIEGIALRITEQVLAKKGFSMDIPSRAASVCRLDLSFSLMPFMIKLTFLFFGSLLQNQIYVKAWDRIVLGEKRSARNFMNVKESRKSAITLRVMQLLHAVLNKRIHITKRDLFYTDVKLFVDQAESDGVLDDVATMIGCTRSDLHVVASDKGLVVGRIQFGEDGDPIDCTRMGVGGKGKSSKISILVSKYIFQSSNQKY